MQRAFRVFGTALRDLFDEFLLLVACNLLWSLMCLPFLLPALYLLAVGAFPLAIAAAALAVLPMGPASAGLQVVALRVTEGRVSKVRDFFAAMRSYAAPAWKACGLWMLGLIAILANIAFYARFASFIGSLVYGLWLYLLVIWVALLIYLFPLIVIQARPSIRILVRNAFLMVLGRPVFTLVTLALMTLILGALTVLQVLPLLLPLFVVALLAQWGMRATQSLIAEAEERRAAAARPPLEEKGRRGQVRPE